MSAGLTIDFNANLARFTGAVDKATNDLNKFQSNTSRISGNINKIFGTLGVGLSLTGFTMMIKGSIDAADKLNDLSKSTGLAVEQLAGLKLASEQSGAELGGVADSINKLSENIGKDADKFAKLGITARDPLEAFKQLADVFVAIRDPQQRAAFGAAALGKSWATAAPLLAEGGDAIGRMVDKGTRLSGMTQELADAADKFNDHMVELNTSASRLGVTIASGLLPATIEFIQQLSDGQRIFGSFSEALFSAGTMSPFKTWGEHAKSLRAEIAGLEDDRQRFARMGADTSALDMALEASKKKLEWAKANQNREALAAFPPGSYRDEGARGLSAPAKPTIDVSKFIGGGDSAAETRAKADEKRLKDFKAFIEERRKGEAQAAADDYQQIQRWNDLADPAAKYRNEIEDIKFSMSEVGGVSREVGEANIALLQQQIDATDKTTGGMRKAWERFSENVQSNLGDVLYNNLNGRFQDIGEVFKQMLLRMAADAAAAQITLSLFGEGSTLRNLFGGSKVPAGGGYSPSGGSFDGGGFTGFGSRSGGIDGKGGFPAILHPNETVLDHTKGHGMRGTMVNQTLNVSIDSRTDRAEVALLVERAVRNGNADLVDKLQRAGAL